MSTISQEIAPLKGGNHVNGIPNPSSTRRKKSPYKAAMSTKVKWALTDSLRKTEDAKLRLRLILEWVHELRQLNSLDIKVLAHLGKLDHQVGILALDVADLESILGRAISESAIADDK